MSDQPDDVKRINDLTSNARNTWFALLGVLVFVGITLMGVEHIDFYGANRATKLPMVDVEVPTSYFFVAAPILTAAIYGYFHLYLIRLWDALGKADETINGAPLGRMISPWLISDAALYYRRLRRSDKCSTPRSLEGGAMILNFLLAWLFGLIILGSLWWQSLPARNFVMSAIAGASFAISTMVGISSLAMMLHRMRQNSQTTTPLLGAPFMQIMGLLVGGAILFYNSYLMTEGNHKQLASLHMIDEEIVVRPPNWLRYHFAKAEFRANWCRREQVPDCKELGSRDMEFEEEWMDRRFEQTLSLDYPIWHKQGANKPDLRRAKLFSSFMTGVSLWNARFDSAVLNGAQMEGANLNFAYLVNIQVEDTHMQRTVFDYSFIGGTVDQRVVFDGTDISAAENIGGAIRYTDLRPARFDHMTDFRNAFLDGSVSYTDDFARQMGGELEKPCQWIDATLDDEQFHAFWHWWTTLSPYQQLNPQVDLWAEGVAPEEWQNVRSLTDAEIAANGLTDCTWNNDDMTDFVAEQNYALQE